LFATSKTPAKQLKNQRAVKQSATGNYRLEQAVTALAAVCAAGLFGWAVALALSLWGDSQLARLPPWRPFALLQPKLDATTPAAAVAAGSSRLVGVAGERAYFMTGSGAAQRSLSLAAGDRLPSGEKLVRVERDAVVLASAGQETRVTVIGVRAEQLNRPVTSSSQAMADAKSGCRLSATDRAAAIFIQPAMAKALTAERATFARMFDVQTGGTGIRAKGTGGTTAMFAIVDGDLLLRADGAPIKSSDAIISDILARVERGNSVVIEGERSGAPRRWVFAPSACAAQSTDAKSASKSSG
jgi:hypothetical protein